MFALCQKLLSKECHECVIYVCVTEDCKQIYWSNFIYVTYYAEFSLLFIF